MSSSSSGDETEDDNGGGYMHSRIQVGSNDTNAVKSALDAYNNRDLAIKYIKAHGLLPGKALAKHGYCVTCHDIKKYMIHYSCEICSKPMCIEHIDQDPQCVFIDLNTKDGMFDGYTCSGIHLEDYIERVRIDPRYSTLRSHYTITAAEVGGDGVLRAKRRVHDDDIDDVISAMARVSVKRSVKREPHTVMANAKPQPVMPASTKRIIQYRHSRS